MTRLEATLLARLFAGVALLAGCAQPAPPVATPSPSPPPASPARSPKNADWSSATNFTNDVLAIFQQRDPRGAWSAKEPLVLTNGKGLTVNLERLRVHCQGGPEYCDTEVAHFTDEAIKISGPEGSKKATPEQLAAIIRPVEYLQSIPEAIRAETLSAPLVADLVVVYVVDQGGAVRGAKAEDLSATGVSRDALPARVRSNLAALLPVPAGKPKCDAPSIAVWATGNYYESSRLLLTEYWKDLARRAQGLIVVAAPAGDSLIVTCGVPPAELKELAAAVEQMWKAAERPISKALLRWTPNGWQEVRP